MTSRLPFLLLLALSVPTYSQTPLELREVYVAEAALLDVDIDNTLRRVAASAGPCRASSSTVVWTRELWELQPRRGALSALGVMANLSRIEQLIRAARDSRSETGIPISRIRS